MGYDKMFWLCCNKFVKMALQLIYCSVFHNDRYFTAPLKILNPLMINAAIHV